MAEDQDAPPREPSAPPAEPALDRPEPPPFRPNQDLIGYIERGQRPPSDSRPAVAR